MKKIWILMALGLMVASCATVREIPVKEVEKVVVRDSVVVKHDTVEIEIPHEVVKEILPQLDTSRLETSMATSTAYLDTTKRVIYHDLKNKEQTIEKPVKVDTKIITIEKEVEKEVPVEVPTPYIPTWCWILIVFNVGYFGIKLGKILFIRH